MTHITEHDSEEERKRDDSRQPRVYFPVPWNTVCIDYLLESIRKGVEVEVCWRFHVGLSCLQLSRR